MSTQEFKITTQSPTDIWRKPPMTDVFNAPTSNSISGSLKSFVRARVTLRLPLDSELVKYDQGGLLLSISSASNKQRKTQWLKTGIEYYMDRPWLGTVGCDNWADWSIVPLIHTDECTGPTATVEIERSADDLGRSLWVYMIVHKNKLRVERIPVREVNWALAEDEDSDVQLTVSAYAARPQPPPANKPSQLEVCFENYYVEWARES